MESPVLHDPESIHVNETEVDRSKFWRYALLVLTPLLLKSDQLQNFAPETSPNGRIVSVNENGVRTFVPNTDASADSSEYMASSADFVHTRPDDYSDGEAEPTTPLSAGSDNTGMSEPNNPTVSQLNISRQNNFKIKNEKYPAHNEIEHFSVTETTVHAQHFFNELLPVLKKEKGYFSGQAIIASFLYSKLETHQQTVVNAIGTIDSFKSQKKKYIDMLPLFGEYFSEDPEIRNRQINGTAVVYELYRNGALKKICDPGTLGGALAAVFGGYRNFYEELDRNVQEMNRLPAPERQDVLDIISRDYGVTLSLEELNFVDVITVIAVMLKEPMSGLSNVSSNIENLHNNLDQKDKKLGPLFSLMGDMMYRQPSLVDRLEVLGDDLAKK